MSLSRKTSRTLYISQRYKKTVQWRFSTGELGKGNSEKMCLQPVSECAECLWRSDAAWQAVERGAAMKKARSPIVELTVCSWCIRPVSHVSDMGQWKQMHKHTHKHTHNHFSAHFPASHAFSKSERQRQRLSDEKMNYLIPTNPYPPNYNDVSLSPPTASIWVNVQYVHLHSVCAGIVLSSWRERCPDAKCPDASWWKQLSIPCHNRTIQLEHDISILADQLCTTLAIKTGSSSIHSWFTSSRRMMYFSQISSGTCSNFFLLKAL